MKRRYFSGKRFCSWLNKMGVSHEEAAELLNVTASTVEEYACGVVSVPPRQVTACRLLLKLKTERLNREKRLRSRVCLSSFSASSPLSKKIG